MKHNTLYLAFASALGLAVAAPTQAGVTVYKDGAKYIEIGGRLQLQYHHENPDAGESTDEVIFRRLRPYIEGSFHKDWKAKIQFDVGKAEDGNEVAIKDAYFQYKGLDNVKVTVGNANFPFSRELLTSSKRQQLVERTFVGDHNYGTPDRNAGIHLTGHSNSKKFTWGASATSASIDPDNDKLDFDTPINANSDFNQGWMAGGRIDFHPLGYLKMSQGHFDRDKTRFTIGAGAFTWSNDDDNNSNQAGKNDVDEITGLELSAALRVAGLSVDAEYNTFDAELVQNGITDGIYENSDTTLENFAVEGGYMLPGNQFELVAGYQSQDADNYAEEWTRSSFGANWYLHEHKAKVQLTYRIGENLDGVDGDDADEIFLQGQFVF
ncbi:MAG: porin [Gammaproteobacteria bacterium]|nr:porin [Gammaproteobacteria bacterium]